jgi:site-specific recombinase XerD
MPPKFIALTLNKLQPHAARNWFKTIKHLMQYAVSVELVRIDPTRDIKLPKASSKEHRPWTDAEIAGLLLRSDTTQHKPQRRGPYGPPACRW